MSFTIAAAVNSTLPGSVRVDVTGTPDTVSSVTRLDGNHAHPVRNYSTTGPSGIEQVIDAEAPLGRAVTYRLLDADGVLLAESGPVTCPAPADGRSLIRSVLKPTVAWMWVEPYGETGVTWPTSTRAYDIPGQDTPIVVGEVRQRHSGTLHVACLTTDDADQLVGLLRDGYPMLIRHACASRALRDMLFYALDVSEALHGKTGMRVLSIDYQSTEFVPGDTMEPASDWDFAALTASAPDFAALTARYETFADMALNRPIEQP